MHLRECPVRVHPEYRHDGSSPVAGRCDADYVVSRIEHPSAWLFERDPDGPPLRDLGEVRELIEVCSARIWRGDLSVPNLSVYRTAGWLVGLGPAPASGRVIPPSGRALLEELDFARAVASGGRLPALVYEVLPDREWAIGTMRTLLWVLAPESAEASPLTPLGGASGRRP